MGAAPKKNITTTATISSSNEPMEDVQTEEKQDIMIPHEETEPEILTEMEITRRALAAQKTVRFIIPTQQDETPGTVFETVNINGCKFEYPRGIYIDVPEQIADMLQTYLDRGTGKPQSIINPRTGRNFLQPK